MKGSVWRARVPRAGFGLWAIPVQIPLPLAGEGSGWG